MVEGEDSEILAEYEYEPVEIKNGYSGKTLYINLNDMTISEKPVTKEMKEKFIGGKGFDLWLLWNAVTSETKWDSPENEICISSGPLGGTIGYPGAGKSIVTTISPETGIPIDSNVGGYFGPYLKFAGFDAMEVQGKTDAKTVIFIDGMKHKVTIERIPDLKDKAYDISYQLHERYGEGKPQNVSVVSTGPAAEHVYMGCLNFSWYDIGRKVVRLKQAGRGGTGTVFRNKGIGAIAARVDRVLFEPNGPADPEALRKVIQKHSSEISTLDPKQNEMSIVGTTHIVDIMNDYDLLPTMNYKFGSHKDALNIGKEVYRKKFDPGFDGCWIGCTVSCSHGVKNFVPRTGPDAGKKVFVDGPEYETIAGCGSNCGIFDPDHVLEINYYCDTYGLDTISVATSTAFVMECYENGIITKEDTGGLELNFGNKDAALELVHQMARGEGFGVIVGKGIRYMKKYFVEKFGADPKFLNDIGMEVKGLEYSEYMTKESLAQQGGYGLALKGPQHDEAWLIFLDMVHGYMPTFEDKAEALHWFPMWRTWFSLNGLCKLPWNDITPEDNDTTDEPAKVPKHLQWYSEFYSAISGQKVTPDDLIFMSERVYNFQRIFNLRMGQGRRVHDKVPYRSVGPVTVEEYESRQDRYDSQLKELGIMDPEGKSTEEKMAALRKYREEQYERLMDAVYQRRGWTKDGVPTIVHVKKLGIDFPDVIELISKYQ